MEHPHNYDPSWDYEIDESSPSRKRIEPLVRSLMKEHAELLDLLGLRTPEVHFVAKLGQLAKYVNGTSGLPVIVVDSASVERQAKKYRVNISDAVDTTLVHEYGHAYLDSTGEHEELDPATEEMIAEEFANDFWKYSDAESSVALLKSLVREREKR